ncbi:hypothetical protein [Roseburia amylophila]|jgi:Rieske Fe-S protein|uniref:Uncharacterized protein n=1 Tax=Roseburia amylophila TaxID=2981794 RepID=A0ABT2SA63_9FIRM|nr:hypothetical protein [Roseburia amylophila]MCU6715953.1 hypothetical protein [Roseburia amylophila]SCH11328.1 Uncharacterised protein [uncultured Roseburia sp.]
MKNRKISTAIAEKVMTGVLTILMAISVTACGSTKEQENSAATEVTEAVVTTETESETATEAKVENEIVTETEAVTETETEEPVLFRVKVTSENGAYLTDQPSDKEYHDFILTDYGTEFDVLEVFNNEAEGYTFYRVNWNGHREFLWDRDATVID